jgi:hypothetical protein
MRTTPYFTRCQPHRTCSPQVAACRDTATRKSHCYGWVTCPSNTCPEWEGFFCVYDGKSNNFKVCADSTCTNTTSPSPSLKRTPYDKCDVTLQALEAGDQEDIRADVYCEFKVSVWEGGPPPCSGHNPAW